VSKHLYKVDVDARIHVMNPDLIFILVLITWFFLYGLALFEVLSGIVKNIRGDAYNEKRLTVRSFIFLLIGAIVVLVYIFFSFLQVNQFYSTELLLGIVLLQLLFLMILRAIQRKGNKNPQSVVYPVDVSEQVQEKQVRIIFFSLLITTAFWSLLRFFNIVQGSYFTSLIITPILTGMTVITFIFWLVFLVAVKPWRKH
jgi:uncharacterized membrane protein